MPRSGQVTSPISGRTRSVSFFCSTQELSRLADDSRTRTYVVPSLFASSSSRWRPMKPVPPVRSRTTPRSLGFPHGRHPPSASGRHVAPAALPADGTASGIAGLHAPADRPELRLRPQPRHADRRRAQLDHRRRHRRGRAGRLGDCVGRQPDLLLLRAAHLRRDLRHPRDDARLRHRRRHRVGLERPRRDRQPHGRGHHQSRLGGTATSGRKADTRLIATATHSAPFSDHPISGPASAEPTGWPTQFTDIDTAKARPNHAGSVLRWRRVNSAMSNGPLATPTTITATATTASDVAKGSRAIAIVLATIAPNISCRSRPWLGTRPASKAETSPAAPRAPHSRPTVAGPECSRSRTSTGTAIRRIPQLRLNVLRVSARPRSVALRRTYSSARQALRSSEPSRPPLLAGSGRRSITAAAAANTRPAAASAHSGPIRPISAPASGAPTRVENT